jgi:hypothetical protein
VYGSVHGGGFAVHVYINLIRVSSDHQIEVINAIIILLSEFEF